MKNKKIKSIKLAKDYRGLYREVLKGTVLEKYSNAYLPDIWRHGDIISFYETQILNNETGLFEIEYEDEHFEYVPTTYSRGITDVLNERNKDFLNKLADWCDEKYKPANNFNMFFILNEYSSLDNKQNLRIVELEKILSADCCISCECIGIKLNSVGSARLFVSELNREENKEAKEYYINLLKSRRLM